MNEKTVSIPEVLAIDFKKMSALGAALEKRINEVNPTRLVPVSTATKYIISLIEKDVNAAAPKPANNNNEIVPEGFFS